MAILVFVSQGKTKKSFQLIMAAQLTYSHHVQEHHQEEWYAAQEGDYIRQYRLC